MNPQVADSLQIPAENYRCSLPALLLKALCKKITSVFSIKAAAVQELLTAKNNPTFALKEDTRKALHLKVQVFL